MRSLKPYVLAVSGFVAAVFSAVFLGAQPESRPVVTNPGRQADLQAKRNTSGAEALASRETKPADKTPSRDPVFPTHARAGNETLRVAGGWASAARAAIAPERWFDWRQRLLVGVVELRI